MIARFQIQLPFLFAVVPSKNLTPIEVERDGGKIYIYPPLQKMFCNQTLGGVAASEKPTESEDVVVNGMKTFEANLLRIDFQKPSFDRKLQKEGQKLYDPPDEFFFEITNWWIDRIRISMQAPMLKPVIGQPFLVQYLNDDGSALPEDPQLYRQRMSFQFTISTHAVDEDLWHHLRTIPTDYKFPIHSALLLDARAALPEIGTSIVLAATAIETLIESCLDVLAKKHGGATESLWSWLADRKGKYWQEPSIAEKFTDILQSLSGTSLKSEPELWEAFSNLKEARNSFVHNGEATVGGRPVDKAKAADLVSKTFKIVSFVEKITPELASISFGKKYEIGQRLVPKVH